MALKLIDREEDAEYLDVLRFHEKFNILRHDKPVHLTQRKLDERIECMEEELGEFKLAVQSQDLEAQADALIDLVYFAKGTAVMLGLPWKALWDDVQRANMAKERGMTKRGHAVDVTKPPGWIGPKTGSILRAHGYVEEHFITVDEGLTFIDERKCKDDASLVKEGGQ